MTSLEETLQLTTEKNLAAIDTIRRIIEDSENKIEKRIIYKFYNSMEKNEISIYFQALMKLYMHNGAIYKVDMINKMKNSAEMGLSDAYIELGWFYMKGYLIDQNYNEMKKCFDQAINMGNSRGFVGYSYYYLHYEKNEKKELEYATKAKDMVNIDGIERYYELIRDKEEHFDEYLQYYVEVHRESDNLFKKNLLKKFRTMQKQLDERKILNDVASGKKSVIFGIAETYL